MEFLQLYGSEGPHRVYSEELKVEICVGRPPAVASTLPIFSAAALPVASIFASGTRLFATAKFGVDS
ncbi:hypothetical protein AMK10_28160 [Streptomyces sp. CB02058]|nr:hypothetical protein AMK10_28160 [Streptomyces sp. CB02058]